MKLLQSIYGILYKELLIEFRTKYSISALLLFILTTVAVVMMSVGTESKSPELISGLLWLIIFFGAMTGLSRSFVSEEESGTSLFLKLNTDSLGIYFGKLMYNIMLNLVVTSLAGILLLSAENIIIRQPISLVISLLFSSIAISSGSTIISVIISKAGAKGAIFPVLSFPVLLPILFLGIDLTINCIAGNTSPLNDIIFLIAYSGVMIAGSVLLFDFVWKE